MTFTGLDLLKRLESCRLEAYLDEGGVLTIGYGHTGPYVHAGTVWTQEQADAQLAGDVAYFDTGVRECLGGIELPDNRFSALVIFAFNIGITPFLGSTALRDIRLGRLDDVPRAIALWNKVRDPSGVPMLNHDLVKRRNAEIALWNS